MKDQVVELYLDDIIPNRFQPREVFDERALKELAVSIKEHGVIQPIIVRNVNGKYEIIAGERRYKASALAGLTKIPAIIRDLDDKESSKVALLENLQRKNLNPIEEARTYQKILELDQMTQEELAKTMGKSQSAVANKIRLLSLSDEIQDSILKEKISERHARALLNVKDAKVQKELMDKVIAEKMSVRTLEETIEKMYPRGKSGEEIPIDDNATTGEFLNDTPLAPTASAIQEEISNYGKVVIAPPKEDNEESSGENNNEEASSMNTEKFINYGEIGKTNDENIGLDGQPLPSTTSHVDIEQEKNNATDIKAPSGAAIDTLLNINTPTTAPLSIEEQQQKEDYFSSPEGPTIQIETEDEQEQDPVILNPLIPTTPGEQTDMIQQEETAITSASPVIEENYTLDIATGKIKDLVEELQQHGINTHIDEMDFPNSYQVIIKIDKEEKID